MPNVMMDAESSGSNLVSEGTISSLIPVTVIKEWTLTMGIYMGDQDHSISSCDLFPQSVISKRAVQALNVQSSTWEPEQLDIDNSSIINKCKREYYLEL